MGRKQRHDPDDGWHHVMNRGCRRYDTFIDDEDRSSFLKIAQRSFSSVEADLVAWCLMGNHYHLLAHCHSGGLSRAMQLLGGHYTRKFNRDHGFDGPLFRSRFTSVTVESEHQLVAVARYIHRNPLELSLDVRTYSWSNFRHFGRSRAAQPVVSLVGGRAAYKSLVESDLPSDQFSIRKGRSAAPTASRASWSMHDVDALIDAESLIDRESGLRVGVLLAVECGRFSSVEIAAHYRLKTAGAARMINTRAQRQLESSELFSNQVAHIRQGLADLSSLAA